MELKTHHNAFDEIKNSQAVKDVENVVRKYEEELVKAADETAASSEDQNQEERYAADGIEESIKSGYSATKRTISETKQETIKARSKTAESRQKINKSRNVYSKESSTDNKTGTSSNKKTQSGKSTVSSSTGEKGKLQLKGKDIKTKQFNIKTSDNAVNNTDDTVNPGIEEFKFNNIVAEDQKTDNEGKNIFKKIAKVILRVVVVLAAQYGIYIVCIVAVVLIVSTILEEYNMDFSQISELTYNFLYGENEETAPEGEQQPDTKSIVVSVANEYYSGLQSIINSNKDSYDQINIEAAVPDWNYLVTAFIAISYIEDEGIYRDSINPDDYADLVEYSVKPTYEIIREFLPVDSENDGIGSSAASRIPVDTLVIEVEMKTSEEIASFFNVELQDFEYVMEVVKTYTLVENAIAEIPEFVPK